MGKRANLQKSDTRIFADVRANSLAIREARFARRVVIGVCSVPHGLPGRPYLYRVVQDNPSGTLADLASLTGQPVREAKSAPIPSASLTGLRPSRCKPVRDASSVGFLPREGRKNPSVGFLPREGRKNPSAYYALVR